MNDSDCPSEDQLVRMVEGALAQDSLSMVEQHVDNCEHCAAVLAGLGAMEHSQTRRTLGRYQLDRRIAAGGMGEVWAAWDPQLRRELAIKFVRPDRADDGRERERLLREARALARLTHPNVLAVHDVGEIDGEVFLVTELVAGDTLATRGGPSSDWRALVRLYAQAARGLAAAHAAGLVHRDVKPANLLLGADGRVRVADFGLAVRSNTPSPVAPTEMPSLGASSNITAAGHIAGTPAYMAPEQRAGLATEAPADQFALCVALGEGIAGRRPPTAPEREALRAFIAERRTIDTSLDELCGVLARGLSLDPDDRFPSMAALADALDVIAGPAPEAIGAQPSGRLRMASGRLRMASGEQRVASGEQRAISGQQRAITSSSTSQLDTSPAESRRASRLAILGLVILAGGAGATGLYFATRGGDASAGAGSGSAKAPDLGGGSATLPAPAPAPPPVAPPAPAGTGQDKTVARPAKLAPQASPRTAAPNRVADTDALGEPPPPEQDDPTKNGPGMYPSTATQSAAPANGGVTLKDVNRAVSRRDGKACRAALAKLVDPPPSDFRVASAHAVCEMVAGNCEGGKREERALRIREGSNPDSVDMTTDLYCSVNDPDPAIRLRRLSRQLSLFTSFECSFYLPAARASGKVVANDRERMQVGSALATIAKCYSDHGDCPTAHKVLGEAQGFIPALGVSELNAACR